jgi:hypothetical protein
MTVILTLTAAIVFASVVVCLGALVNFARESRREARLQAELDAEWERHLASAPTEWVDGR